MERFHAAGRREVEAHLKRLGLRVTALRLQLYEFFLQPRQRHWTVDEIYRAMLEQGCDVGLANTYRVVTDFAKAGMLLRHVFDSGSAVYEVNVGAPHGHAVCTRCGGIQDLDFDVGAASFGEAVASSGYQMTGYALTLYGICPACACRPLRR